jgi:hypothetical protein
MEINQMEINQEESNYFDDLKKKTIVFMKENKIELIVLFCVIFLIFLIRDLKNYSMTKFKYCGLGGYVPAASIQRQSGMTAQTGQIKYSLSRIAYTKLGSTIMNNSFFRNMMCYSASFLKSIVVFGSIILSVMLIPGIPVFGFMLLLFVILRDKMANIKAL